MRLTGNSQQEDMTVPISEGAKGRDDIPGLEIMWILGRQDLIETGTKTHNPSWNYILYVYRIFPGDLLDRLTEPDAR